MMKFLCLFAFLGVFQLKGQQYIPNGKMAHIQAGAIISVLSYSGISLIYKDRPAKERKHISRNVSIATVFVAALGREIYDYFKYESRNAWNFDTRIDGYGDFVTTCLAGMSVTLAIPF